ncbi:hypothetical protein DFQ28_004448 [Apophysomyces sp. BC1034]|nr:hypothetical protein DFQ29_003453 [Apophysomyces sp. BC1021]KAG0188720.1 hypothetical protein DFQ28_004448 [Apophysomyces sp. BC1034]
MGGLKIDPSIERWAHVRENTHLYFNWSKKTTRSTLLWFVAVPVGLTYLAFKTDRKWNFTAAQTKEQLCQKN